MYSLQYTEYPKKEIIYIIIRNVDDKDIWQEYNL